VWSEEEYRIYGLDPAQPSPEYEVMLDKCIYPEDRKLLHEAFTQAMQGQTIFEVEHRIVCPDGTIKWVYDRAHPYFDEQGELVRYIGTTLDITQRKEYERQLVLLRQSAVAADRAKSQFLANMSHELRTPLSGVIGMLELARRRATDATQADWLEKAHRSADHLLTVVNDILDLSKIEAGQMTIRRAEFTLAVARELLTDLVLPEAARRGLYFDVEIDGTLARRPLRGDQQRLVQVLVNLASNAVKFTDTGGVRVRTTINHEAPGELMVRFEVRDTGIGIAHGDQARLFQPFQQLDVTSARRLGGTGLGLALSARMVQLMGGQIGLDSTPGSGSTFWFTVPLEPVSDAAATALPATELSALESLATRCGGLRLLLAEDNPIIQEVLLALLEDAGLLIDVAADGAAAVEMALANNYALILMDVHMPKLSGIEAARAIRRSPTHGQCPIIALTANAFQDDREQCIEAGMDEHLAKPVVPEVLYTTLLKWLLPA
jgi:signal transduction histidine kinase/CheY-like chemotaxis protein